MKVDHNVTQMAKVPALHDYHRTSRAISADLAPTVTISKRILSIPSPKKSELKVIVKN